jgi:hypothetical protein
MLGRWPEHLRLARHGQPDRPHRVPLRCRLEWLVPRLTSPPGRSPLRDPNSWRSPLAAPTRSSTGRTSHGTSPSPTRTDLRWTAFTVTTDDTITVGTTAIAFAKFGAGIAYTAGTGLILTGTQFAINTTVVARKFSTNVGDGSSTTITVSHNLGTLDVVAQLYLVNTGETVETDTVRPSTGTVAFTFATAPAAGALRAVITG